MFDIIRNVISAGGYKLADMQYKIKKLYALGDLTENQLDQLLVLADLGASAEAERPEVLIMLTGLAEKMEDLENRVQALEGGETGEEEQYPAWKAWDGISRDYQPGAVVSHNGKLWQSVYAGQNVWEPGVTGTGFWEAYQEGSA